MSKLQMHKVEEDEAGIRLDRWFKRHFPNLTHVQLQKMLRTGQVRVSGKRAETSTRLEAGQDIRVPPMAAEPAVYEAKKSERDASDIKKMILFEDEDVMVLNKPPGLAVQGGSGLSESIDDMLVSLTHRRHGRPKLVHRLDRGTSGVLLVAKTAFAAAKLSESFRQRETQKIYWAITLGVPKPEKGRIDLPLVRRGEAMAVAVKKNKDFDQAKNAVTIYQNMERALFQAAFVAMWPVTGRTHQLRVHMAHMGTPLLGDTLYGGVPPEGMMPTEIGQGLHLHARRLIIPHPRGGGMIDVSAPLSKEMRKTWKWFGFDAKADADFSDA